MNFDIKQKPDPAVCPCQFCFFWSAANGKQRGRSVEERLYTTEGKCWCDFGICIRLNPEEGDRDWYSTDNPDLEEAGLPWFYFIPSPDSLVPHARDKYIADSEALWGREHWKVSEYRLLSADDSTKPRHSVSGTDTHMSVNKVDISE